MTYQAEISRTNPTCFFFLIDQSSSMMDPIMGVQGNPRKAEFVADALNKVIQSLVVTATKDVEIRRYFQFGAIGYGNVVDSVLAGGSSETPLVWVDELANNPLRIEERMVSQYDGAGGYVQLPTKFPIWIDPLANGRTPMCEALTRTQEILQQWVQEHPMAYPPTVINLTDGEANDGDPRLPAQTLKDLATSDGNVILMTLHASSNPLATQIFFPDTDEVLPDAPSKLMFEMCSNLTQAMINTAQSLLGTNFSQGARAMVYNSDIAGIVNALEIGTRPANLR
jgi:uncharacterized protein YegL